MKNKLVREPTHRASGFFGRSEISRKIKNFFKLGRRWSTNPQKQLCFLWLNRVLARSSAFDTTLDAACGNLNNYPCIKSRRYIGFDINEYSLAYGRKIYPKADTFALGIEDLGNSGLCGDLVLCTQTIGVNSYFDAERTLPSISTLIQSTNTGGTLCFDTGPQSSHLAQDIEQLLRDNFSSVSVKAFGSHDRKSNIVVSIGLAMLMNMSPGMATKQYQNRYFFVASEKFSTPDKN